MFFLSAPTVVARRHLVDDEIVEVRDRARVVRRARLRIWMGREVSPAVLVSQLAGQDPPNWNCTKFANLVNRAFLGFPADGCFYFEADRLPREPEHTLWVLTFEAVGSFHRATLTRPTREARPWHEIELFAGEKVAC